MSGFFFSWDSRLTWTALDGVQNVVLLFSVPSYEGEDAVPSTIIKNLTAVSSDIAYSDYVTDNLTVLTSKYTATQNGVLQGLLYVPDLPPGDPCAQAARAHVPDSAVRQSNLPATNYNLIALAPWFDPNCTLAYLASARHDPLRAFVFYRPNASDAARPPDPGAPDWDLRDDGAWQSANHYPVFAVSGALGAEMMYQLSLYSGNLSDVPFGDNISALYRPDPDDYVRIWTELAVSTPTGLPYVWVFVLAVLGVLLAVVLLICLAIHLVWRRRRNALRARVLRGDIHLEAMGIQRLTVPASHLHKFPLFTYHYDPPSVDDGSETVASDARSRSTSHPASHPTSRPASRPVGPLLPDDHQPDCRICLEPFLARATVIRELPCGHIFHPDCIDEFLSHVSSLCPLCKASMLPRGYCPPITNAMVRRERAIRRLRLRERVVVAPVRRSSAGSRPRASQSWSWGSSWKKHLHTAIALSDQAAVAAPSPATSDATRRRMAELVGVDEHALGDLGSPLPVRPARSDPE